MKEENDLLTSPLKTNKIRRANSDLSETKEATPLKRVSRNPQYSIGGTNSFMLKPNSESQSKSIIHSSHKEVNNIVDQTLPQSLAKIKVSMPVFDNYEQVSNSPSLFNCQSHPLKKVLCDKGKQCAIHLPKITTKKYWLDQLIKLVDPTNKWDTNYKTFKDCVKKAIKYNPGCDVLCEDEKRRIELGDSLSYIKTSLTKQIKKKAFLRSNSNFPIQRTQKTNLSCYQDKEEQDYSVFVMNEKENEKKGLLKKLQDIQASYEKQRYNHRGNAILLKPIPLHQLKRKNQECLIVNQQGTKRRIEGKVANISTQIHILRNNILNVLEQNLSGFKDELKQESNSKFE